MQIDRVVPAAGGGTAPIAGMFFFTKSLTPAAAGATLDVQEQTFATIGSPVDLLVTDQVLVLQPPGAIGAHIVPVGGRATATQTIVVQFANLTAAANTPAAGVYGFLVFRS